MNQIRVKVLILAAIFLLPWAPGSFAAIAIYAADAEPWVAEVAAKIAAAGSFDAVDVYDARVTTPTLAELQAYEAVYVWSNSSFANPDGLGDALADYVDAGGGVVVSTFAFWSTSINLGGRFVTGGYLPFTQGSQASPGGLTLVPVTSGHPLLAGVVSFNGGTSSYHNAPIAPVEGATLVAEWSNGQPLVGFLGRVVGLNFFPPSTDSRDDFWDAATDGAILMVNALNFVAGATPQPPGEAVAVPALGLPGLILLSAIAGLLGWRRLRRA